jgi:DNA polymerase-3 subunit delta
MLARHTRQLWTVKSMLSQGETPDSVAKKAKIHPFVAKKLAGQAGRFEVSRLRESMVQFFEADRALKSSRLDGGTIVETLVLDLCGVKSVDRRYST